MDISLSNIPKNLRAMIKKLIARHKTRGNIDSIASTLSRPGKDIDMIREGRPDLDSRAKDHKSRWIKEKLAMQKQIPEDKR